MAKKEREKSDFRVSCNKLRITDGLKAVSKTDPNAISRPYRLKKCRQKAQFPCSFSEQNGEQCWGLGERLISHSKPKRHNMSSFSKPTPNQCTWDSF